MSTQHPDLFAALAAPFDKRHLPEEVFAAITDARLRCSDQSRRTPDSAIRIAAEAIRLTHLAFGAPGDYGYGSLRGQSLQYLYSAWGLLLNTLEKDDPDDPAS